MSKESNLERNLIELENLEKERESKLPEFILKSREHRKKAKKWTGRFLRTVAGTAVAVLLQTIFPTWPQHIKYYLTDKATETATERRIEQEFGINYWGDKDEEVLKILESDLRKIKEKRPILLAYLNGITLFPKEDVDVWYTRPFLRFYGRANSKTDNVELLGLGIDIEKHEFAHIAHNNLPDELTDKVAEINKDSIRSRVKYLISLLLNEKNVWGDGKNEPRYGQVHPHGMDAVEETIATYVEKLDDLSFWEHPAIRKDPRYVQNLEVLAEYGLATPKEVQDIKDTINLYNPEFVSNIVISEIDKITPPKYLDGFSHEFASEETYYESEQLKLSYVCGHRDCSIYLTVKLSSGKSASFEIEKESGKLTVVKSLKDVSEFFPQQALDKLQELGYDALFDWEAREKLKEGK